MNTRRFCSPIPVTWGGWVVPPQWFSNTSWWSYKSTQFQHCLPGDGIRPHRLLSPTRQHCPPSGANSKSRWSSVCRTHQLSVRGPSHPSSSSINFLERLTELREIFYLLVDQFLVKGCSATTARWKRRTGQCMGRVERVSMPWAHHSPQTSTCSPTLKLSEARPLGFSRGPHYIVMIDQIIRHWWWFNLQPLPHPRSQRMRSSNLQLQDWVSRNQPPHLGYLVAFQKSPH